MYFVSGAQVEMNLNLLLGDLKHLLLKHVIKILDKMMEVNCGRTILVLQRATAK